MIQAGPSNGPGGYRASAVYECGITPGASSGHFAMVA
jgi:hypothetical protein